MRETITSPEYLRAKQIVREIVAVDCACFAAMLGYILYLNNFMLLLFGLFATVPLLICDLGSWTLDLQDLRRRAILGGAGLVGTIASVVVWRHTRDLLPVLGGYATLCAISLFVFPYARRVALRHQPMHHGGGAGAGKAAMDATAAPPTSGLPSGWVGRRRFF